MTSYSLYLTDDAKEDIRFFKKAGDKSTIRKIELLLEELQIHPSTGTGKPKQLKGALAGYWSRRINKKPRLIYCIEEKHITVIIISAQGHYDDK